MKRKSSINKIKIIFCLSIVFALFSFLSFSNPFSNLTLNQKILLAQAYYKVALYYYDKGDKEKGDAFKSVAHYLDPNFTPKEISFIQEPLTDEQIEAKINEAREKAPSFIEDFCKKKEKNYLSYPFYNLLTADLFTEENIDALLNIEDINYYFNKNFEISKVEYSKVINLSSFLPLVYLEDDLIYVVHDKDSDKMVVLLIRNFGIELKIIGFLPVEKKTMIK